ncbi:MAG TPA: arsenate reductase ArsC [Thermodesulfobacteriota bacterium]|jgi:arsenate reductase|nr:arsenate reductase ArsC [Thermodesulfobacteriota bacterium]
MTEIKKKVLFLCTANSARSQIAEGLMKSMGGEQWEVKSAGILPSYVHPLAIRVMDEVGIDISKQTSKSQNQFLKEEFDYIITLCDHAAMACPNFPGQGIRLHWSIEDPAMAIGTMDERVAVFRRARDEIRTRIERFLKSKP